MEKQESHEAEIYIGQIQLEEDYIESRMNEAYLIIDGIQVSARWEDWEYFNETKSNYASIEEFFKEIIERFAEEMKKRGISSYEIKNGYGKVLESDLSYLEANKEPYRKYSLKSIPDDIKRTVIKTLESKLREQ